MDQLAFCMTVRFCCIDHTAAGTVGDGMLDFYRRKGKASVGEMHRQEKMSLAYRGDTSAVYVLDHSGNQSGPERAINHP